MQVTCSTILVMALLSADNTFSVVQIYGTYIEPKYDCQHCGVLAPHLQKYSVV